MKNLTKLLSLGLAIKICMNIGNKVFAIIAKDPLWKMGMSQASIIFYNLEWCVYLLLPSILFFIVSLIWILILKLKNKNSKIIKVLYIALAISIICLCIVGIKFTYFDIGIKAIMDFLAN